jgi:NAD+-dependent secondary alcohol dehydrogenase Adh1
MKAALLTSYNQDWELSEVPDPEILAPDEVIIRIGAAGFCRTDVHIWDGQFDEAMKAAGAQLPFVCGHENAGWVQEIGSGVTHVKVGDPVLLHALATCGLCRPCRSGDDFHCTNSYFPGVMAQGGFAQYMRTKARSCVPIPEGVAPLEVGPLACGGITAYRAVKKVQTLAWPGSHSVVIGAGGLGHLGIQCLRALTETDIVVLDRNQAALDHAETLGADHTVLARADGSHIAEIQELTSGGAEVVIDFVGEGGVQNDAPKMLGLHGVDMVVGYGGGLELDISANVLGGERGYMGSALGTYTEMLELLAMVRRGSVKITQTNFGLHQVNDVFRALEDGALVGRGVLVPNES